MTGKFVDFRVFGVGRTDLHQMVIIEHHKTLYKFFNISDVAPF